MTLPYSEIAPIPDNQPEAVPSLWNTRYTQIDLNFANLDQRVSNYESELSTARGGKTSLDARLDDIEQQISSVGAGAGTGTGGTGSTVNAVLKTGDTMTGNLTVSNANPRVVWHESDKAPNEKWHFSVENKAFSVWNESINKYPFKIDCSFADHAFDNSTFDTHVSLINSRTIYQTRTLGELDYLNSNLGGGLINGFVWTTHIICSGNGIFNRTTRENGGRMANITAPNTPKSVGRIIWNGTTYLIDWEMGGIVTGVSFNPANPGVVSLTSYFDNRFVDGSLICFVNPLSFGNSMGSMGVVESTEDFTVWLRDSNGNFANMSFTFAIFGVFDLRSNAFIGGYA